MRLRPLATRTLAALIVAVGSATGATGDGQDTAAPAPPASGVVLGTLRFVGLDADVVGSGFGLPGGLPRNPKPNGNSDGHFSVTLKTPDGARMLRSVILERQADRKTMASVPPAWQTAPAKTPPLGVVLGGKRLNPSDEVLAAALPRSSKGIRLDLYANEMGQFLPGQRYRVIIGTAAAGSRLKATSTPWLTLPGGAATLSASFVGRGEDRIGNFAFPTPLQPDAPAPDGLPDAHFGAQVDTRGAWRVIVHVVVQHIDAQGRGIGKPGGEYCRPEVQREIAANGWSTGRLLLLVNGRPVELQPEWGKGPEGPTVTEPIKVRPFPRCAPRGDPPSKPTGINCPIYVPLPPSKSAVRLDVYIDDPDPGLARPGERFRLTVYFSDYVLGTLTGPPGTATTTLRIS